MEAAEEEMAEAEDRDHKDVRVETLEVFGTPMVHEIQLTDDITVAEMHITNGQDMGGMLDMLLEHVRGTKHELVVAHGTNDGENEVRQDVGLQLDVAEIRRGWKRLSVWQN